MTLATSPNLLVTDPSSLEYLDRLVSIAGKMMDGMVHSPESLAGFLGVSLPAEGGRYVGCDKGVRASFDFGPHQKHPVTLTLTTHYDGEQTWELFYKKALFLFKPLACRVFMRDATDALNSKFETPVDGQWQINKNLVRSNAAAEALIQSIAHIVKNVVKQSHALEELLSHPSYIKEARREKCARNGFKFIEPRQALVVRKPDMGDPSLSMSASILTVNLSQKKPKP